MCCQWTSSRRETKIHKEKRAYRLGLFVHMDTAPRHQPTAPQPPSPSHCSSRGGDVWMSCCTRRSGRSGGASEAAWSDDQLPWTWGPAHHGSHPASCVCPSGHRSRNDWAHQRQVRSDPSGYAPLPLPPPPAPSRPSPQAGVRRHTPPPAPRLPFPSRGPRSRSDFATQAQRGCCGAAARMKGGASRKGGVTHGGAPPAPPPPPQPPASIAGTRLPATRAPPRPLPPPPRRCRTRGAPVLQHSPSPTRWGPRRTPRGCPYAPARVAGTGDGRQTRFCMTARPPATRPRRSAQLGCVCSGAVHQSANGPCESTPPPFPP